MGGEINYSALEIRFEMNGVKSPTEIIYLLDAIKEYLDNKHKNEVR